MKNFKGVIEGGDALVIAEIGINHDGNLAKAERLISAAHASGCKAVKFQYRNLDRIYGSVREIGDEIIETEIRKNFISPDSILELCGFARRLGLYVGISFFTEADLNDFDDDLRSFDFFKVPSVEHQNWQLINKLCSIDPEKLVLIATGMSTEITIENSFSKFEYSNWMPLHCVSNYPVEFFNSQLGYIPTLAANWRKAVGYSSHDSNWGMCIIAAAQGAQIIERHITLSKDSNGLDHTSSSDPEEMKMLCEIINNYKDCVKPTPFRKANQGEKLNQQNLGRSLYAARSIGVGEIFNIDDFEYLSPQTGLSLTDADQLKEITYSRPLATGDVLTQSHFSQEREFPASYRAFADEHRISLPVRIHDFVEIKKYFGISNFEFHLSYKELGGKQPVLSNLAGDRFTLHLPDYCSSHAIIDPFSSNSDVRTESRRLINNGIEFANRLEDETGNQVEIVGSFSKHMGSDPDFYDLFRDFLETFVSNRAKLSLQWLPPIAWYFGGSVRLDVMNNLHAVSRILQTDLPIVMDTSHLFLGSEYFGFDPQAVAEELSNLTSWYHISAASGIDGEGNGFLDMSKVQGSVIKKVIQTEKPKVVEVWQGHLNHFEGFQMAIRDLYALVNLGDPD